MQIWCFLSCKNTVQTKQISSNVEHNKRNIRNISFNHIAHQWQVLFLESSYYSVWTPWFKQTDKKSIQYYVELHRTSCYASWDHHVQASSCEMQVAEADILLLPTHFEQESTPSPDSSTVSKTLYCELQKCWWKTTNRLRPWNPDGGRGSNFMGERQSSALVLLKKSLRSRVINESLRKLRGLVTIPSYHTIIPYHTIPYHHSKPVTRCLGSFFQNMKIISVGCNTGPLGSIFCGLVLLISSDIVSSK